MANFFRVTEGPHLWAENPEPPERVHVGSVQGSGLNAEPNFGQVHGSQILLKNWMAPNFGSTSPSPL